MLEIVITDVIIAMITNKMTMITNKMTMIAVIMLNMIVMMGTLFSTQQTDKTSYAVCING